VDLVAALAAALAAVLAVDLAVAASMVAVAEAASMAEVVAATAVVVDTGNSGLRRTTEVPLIDKEPACLGRRAFCLRRFAELQACSILGASLLFRQGEMSQPFPSRTWLSPNR
jgi:hypothetical protein